MKSSEINLSEKCENLEKWKESEGYLRKSISIDQNSEAKNIYMNILSSPAASQSVDYVNAAQNNINVREKKKVKGKFLEVLN